VSRQPKLSLEQVEDIRRRYEPGLNSRRRGNAADLAAEFGVTQTYITILVRETRRDEDPLAARNRSDMVRLLAAGLSEQAAAKVIAHPNRRPRRPRTGPGSDGYTPEPCPGCCCEVCGQPTDTPPECARCACAEEARAKRSADR
jgi:hypothetical protein